MSQGSNDVQGSKYEALFNGKSLQALDKSSAQIQVLLNLLERPSRNFTVEALLMFGMFALQKATEGYDHLICDDSYQDNFLRSQRGQTCHMPNELRRLWRRHSLTNCSVV